MPRSLVIGNGQILATFDDALQMRDLYFPYVGMEDQTGYGNVHRTGVWVSGKGFAWLSDPSWQITAKYRPDSLVGESTLRNDKLGIEIIAEDFVHPFYNVLIRNFRIRTTDGNPKEVRVFFNHNLFIYGDKQKDTAFYEPYTNSIVHYRQTRYFLIGGDTSDPVKAGPTGQAAGEYQSILHSKEKLKSCGISAFSIGKANYQGYEGTWKDAEDGELSNTTIDQGSVDSTVGIHCGVRPAHETKVTLWVCMGRSLDEVVDLQQMVLSEGQERLQSNCHNYWKSWVCQTCKEFGSLSNELIDLFRRSLLTIRLHADNRGGIMAAADADIMAFNRDTYTYVWPRDGAFISLAMDHAHYHEVTRRFFEFCCKVQTPDGYLLHKYNPDGSIGSSWHPWFRDGEAQMPIQEDETALVIYALWKHFERTQDFEFLQEMYERFVKKAGQFLVEFREERTGLPLPSYDPWEEHRGVFTYTVATVAAGLHAAAQISQILGHHTHSERFHTAADETRQALLFHLFDEEHNRFVKFIRRKDEKTVEKNLTVDASVVAIWTLGVLPVTDPRVISTMRQMKEQLTVQTQVGGIARFTNDVYHAKTQLNKEITGNPWIITTLWDAQWTIAQANKTSDLEPARKILEWVAKYASKTGLLAEQLHPLTGAPLSVAPLTWSHATYVETVLQFIEKEKVLLK
ncbi:MAG: glycoside hydrolase family 15 protein [Candidatus Peribacteraceae bacterium]|nr:glycoside hydrolase family 15 protein [Candidatus Peribacteraceae bacterium]MDD5074386.1 glycoside hydrolase family 15 protein [Candidatus Peribacteraceae bacterium]